MLNQRMGVDGQFEGEKVTSDNLWSIFADRAAMGESILCPDCTAVGFNNLTR